MNYGGPFHRKYRAEPHLVCMVRIVNHARHDVFSWKSKRNWPRFPFSQAKESSQCRDRQLDSRAGFTFLPTGLAFEYLQVKVLRTICDGTHARKEIALLLGLRFRKLQHFFKDGLRRQLGLYLEQRLS